MGLSSERKYISKKCFHGVLIKEVFECLFPNCCKGNSQKNSWEKKKTDNTQKSKNVGS